MKKLKAHYRSYSQRNKTPLKPQPRLSTVHKRSDHPTNSSIKLPKIKDRRHLQKLQNSRSVGHLKSFQSANILHSKNFDQKYRSSKRLQSHISNVSIISAHSQCNRSLSPGSFNMKKMLSKSYANHKNLGETLSGFSKRVIPKLEKRIHKLTSKTQGSNFDVKNVTNSGFIPYQALKATKDKEIYPNRKFLLNLKRGEISYFYCTVDKVNFPVTLNYTNKKKVAQTIVSFRRERPKKEHAEIISQSDHIYIKYPYVDKPKKQLQASGMMLQIHKELNGETQEDQDSLQKDAEGLKQFQANKMKEKKEKQKTLENRIKIKKIYFSVLAHSDFRSLALLNFRKYKRSKNEEKRGKEIQQQNQQFDVTNKKSEGINYKMFKDFCKYVDIPYIQEVKNCGIIKENRTIAKNYNVYKSRRRNILKLLNKQRRKAFQEKHINPNEAYIAEAQRKIKEKEDRIRARRRLVENIILQGITITRQRVMLGLILVPSILELIWNQVKVRLMADMCKIHIDTFRPKELRKKRP